MAKVAVAVALVAIGVSGASAATPIRVSLARPVPAAVVGEGWTARLAVRPASFRGKVQVTAAGPGRVAAAATRSGAKYRVRLVFPAVGRWTLTARAGGRLSSLGAVQVRRPGPTPLPFTEPTNIELQADGTLILVENNPGRILRVDPSKGTIDVLAAGLSRPFAASRTPSGAILISGGTWIRRLDTVGAVTTVLELDTDTGPITVAPNGDVYFTTATSVFRLSGGTGAPVRVAGSGVSGGAGDGGPATAAQLSAPHGLAIAADGAILIADTGNDRIRRVDPATGVITSIAQVGIPDGIDVAADGSVYVVDGRAERVVHLNAAGDRIGFLGPTFRIPYDVEVAPDGSVYVIAAGPTGRLHHVAPDGTSTVVSRP